MQHHIVYYEPSYDNRDPNLWQLRGQYKYPSIIGKLGKSADISIMMHTLPPKDDPYRKNLENDYGVQFLRLLAPSVAVPENSVYLSHVVEQTLKAVSATVVSNLNGRSVPFCWANALAAKRLGIRNVMRIGGDDLETKANIFYQSGRPFSGSREYYNLLSQERLATEICDAIIVMNRKEQIRLSAFTTKPEKIHVCYRGVDQTHFNAEEPRHGSCRKFLFVGRQSREKGYDLLEVASQKIWQKRKDIQFTFAGTFDIQKVQNRDYIGYINYNELPLIYGSHDAVVLCSRSDGFPQVFMEAMSMGLPCIVSEHLFRADFNNRETALFCTTTADSVEEAVLELVNDDALYHHISKTCFVLAKENFSADAMNERYCSIMLGEELDR